MALEFRMFSWKPGLANLADPWDSAKVLSAAS